MLLQHTQHHLIAHLLHSGFHLLALFDVLDLELRLIVHFNEIMEVFRQIEVALIRAKKLEVLDTEVLSSAKGCKRWNLRQLGCHLARFIKSSMREGDVFVVFCVRCQDLFEALLVLVVDLYLVINLSFHGPNLFVLGSLCLDIQLRR